MTVLARTIIVLTASLLLASCSSKSQVHHYKAEGKVLAIDKEHHSLTLDEKAIPDYMEAMPMIYPIADAHTLDTLKVGDQIEATLTVTPDKSTLENIRVTNPAPEASPAK